MLDHQVRASKEQSRLGLGNSVQGLSSSSRKVRMCLPMSSGFSSQLPMNRCMKVHAQTTSKYVVTLDTQNYLLGWV